MNNRTITAVIAAALIFGAAMGQAASVNQPSPKVLKLLDKLGLRAMLERERTEQQQKSR